MEESAIKLILVMSTATKTESSCSNEKILLFILIKQNQLLEKYKLIKDIEIASFFFSTHSLSCTLIFWHLELLTFYLAAIWVYLFNSVAMTTGLLLATPPTLMISASVAPTQLC